MLGDDPWLVDENPFDLEELAKNAGVGDLATLLGLDDDDPFSLGSDPDCLDGAAASAEAAPSFVEPPESTADDALAAPSRPHSAPPATLTQSDRSKSSRFYTTISTNSGVYAALEFKSIDMHSLQAKVPEVNSTTRTLLHNLKKALVRSLRPIILSPEDTSELHKCFSSKSRTISVNITSLAKLSEKLGHDFFTILFYQPNPAKEEYKLKKYIHCKPMRVEATPTPTVNDGRDSSSHPQSAPPATLTQSDRSKPSRFYTTRSTNSGVYAALEFKSIDMHSLQAKVPKVNSNIRTLLHNLKKALVISLRPIILSPEDTSELHKCFSSKSRTISVNITSLAKLSEKLGHDFFTILFYQPNPAKEEYKLKKYIHCKPMRVEATPTPTVNDGRDSRVASAVPSDLMDEDDHSGFSSPANPLLACKPVELPNAGFFGRQMRPILQPLSPDSPVKAAPAAASSGGLFSAKAFSSPSGTTNSQTYSSLEFKPIGEHHLRAVISIKIKKAGDYLNNLRSSLRVRLGVSHESRLLFNSCFESIGSPIDPANGKRTITITVDTKELSELDPGYEEQLFYEAKPGIYMLLPYAPAAADASQLQRSFAAAARR